MEVRELYDSIHGDYERALETMMSDDFIKRMLAKFLDNVYYSGMTEAYEKKDYRKLFEASHGFKSLFGNLGMSLLAEKASFICESARNLPAGAEINLDKEMDEFVRIYDDAFAKINAFVS